MKTSNFNEHFLFDKILREEKTSFLMGDFIVNLLNIENKSEILEFYDCLSSHLFIPYILQPTRIMKLL